MIARFEIAISTGNTTKKTELICDNEAISITATLEDDSPRTYIESDFYKCFGLLRKANPSHNIFL
jgi:hypothetical protein